MRCVAFARPAARAFSILIALALLMTPALAAAQDASPAARTGPKDLILATTTSTQDSGLLDVLVPMFERQTGYVVKTIAVGSGQAMELGRRGEADVLLVHSPAAEAQYMAGGYGVSRQIVMYNDFIIVGPSNDPAGIEGMTSAIDAMRQIAATESPFVSRGDDSGTNALELKLWNEAGIAPAGGWYTESGTGMGDTLNITNERQAYTISDRATYLALRDRLDLAILVEGDPSLLNVYHVIPVNPANGRDINAAGGRAFADFLLAPATQDTIGAFGTDTFGQRLFTPCADNRCGLEATPAAAPVATPAA
ncbi:MAG TPA: substrate-binding domain-containing protein [Thermomicrobiales bacterium]|nr:substrate-binding domain-containing protein [Thermomicrobiales bacterium]